MLVKQSTTNPLSLEFFKEPQTTTLPIWEFSLKQLKTRKEALIKELDQVSEMIAFFRVDDSIDETKLTKEANILPPVY